MSNPANDVSKTLKTKLESAQNDLNMGHGGAIFQNNPAGTLTLSPNPIIYTTDPISGGMILRVTNTTGGDASSNVPVTIDTQHLSPETQIYLKPGARLVIKDPKSSNTVTYEGPMVTTYQALRNNTATSTASSPIAENSTDPTVTSRNGVGMLKAGGVSNN